MTGQFGCFKTYQHHQAFERDVICSQSKCSMPTGNMLQLPTIDCDVHMSVRGSHPCVLAKAHCTRYTILLLVYKNHAIQPAHQTVSVLIQDLQLVHKKMDRP